MIQRATTNLNKTKNEKYGIEPEIVEQKSLEGDNFREKYDFHRLSRIGQDFARTDRFNAKKDQNKRIRLREPLEIGEKVSVFPGGFFYYWLSAKNSDRIDTKRYIRQELFALRGQWR